MNQFSEMKSVRTVFCVSHKLQYPTISNDKFFPGVAILTALLVWTSAARAAESMRVTLFEAFERVEEANLEALIQRQAVEEAFQAALEGKAALLPAVNLNLTQLRRRSVNAGLGFGEVPLFPPSNRYDGKLVGSVPLLDVVKLAAWRLTKFDHEISKLTYDGVMQFVLESTTRAYFTHLRNIRRIEVLDTNIVRDKVLLTLAENQLRAGVATRIDVTRAEVAIADDEKVRIQQDTVVMASALRLKLLLDLDLDVNLEVVMMDPLKPIPVRAYGLDAQILLGARPEYLKAVKELERNRVARRLAGFESLPTVNLFAEWGFASREFLDGNAEEAWLAGIVFDVPIFEGFRIRSSKRRADAFVRIQEFTVRDIEQNIGADYRLAIQDAESRFKQIAVVVKRAKLGEEELELAQTRFTEGVADNREVIDAQASLAEANDELIETVYQYNLSRLNLASVRGDIRLILSE